MLRLLSSFWWFYELSVTLVIIMSDSWICNACTFENENVSADTCDMCSTRRQNVGNKNTTTKEPRQHTLFGKLSEEIDLTSSKPSRKRKKPPQAPSAAPLQSFFVPCADTQATIFPPYTLSPSHKFSCHDIHSVLKAVFKLDSLRQNLQTQAIETALRQQSQLLVLATGGGKSLCYQLPACLLGGVTIVISPLIALMQDQIQGLSERGVPAACISSQQTDKENQVVLHRVLDSKERPLTILYITPESIQTDRMRQVLVELNKQKRLTMFAVDEAHCLSR